MGIRIISYLPSAGEVQRIADHPQAVRNSAPGTAQKKISGSPGTREATLDYMTQCCLAAEYAGSETMLVPMSAAAHDPLVLASALMTKVQRLKFLVAFRPGLLTPVLFAQMVSSFQQLSGNRVMLNVTPGVPGHASNRYGDWHDKTERMEQSGEFLTVMKGAWGPEPFDFSGRFYEVKGASVTPPPVVPRIYYAGSSELSMRFAAKHADVYMSYLEPIEGVKERFERVKNMAADEGRQVEFALSFGITARETNAEAWAATAELMTGLDMSPEAVQKAVEGLAAQGYAASGARTRLIGAMNGDYGKLEIAPNLWIGLMLMRGGAPPGLVGSYDEIADRVAEIHALGVDELLTGDRFPSLEGHYHFAEKVMPHLRARGLCDDTAPAPALAG